MYLFDSRSLISLTQECVFCSYHYLTLILHLTDTLSFVLVTAYLSVCLYLCLSDFLSICLLVCLSIYLSICYISIICACHYLTIINEQISRNILTPGLLMRRNNHWYVTPYSGLLFELRKTIGQGRFIQ
jgi:hypothetical protein